eukprot:UN33342
MSSRYRDGLCIGVIVRAAKLSSRPPSNISAIFVSFVGFLNRSLIQTLHHIHTHILQMHRLIVFHIVQPLY